KLNYELLGNADAHLHWHIFSRYDTDLEPNTVTWKIDENVRCSNKAKPNSKELDQIREKLFRALKNTTSNIR
ncbi:MAG: HIT family protein, partial [Patescibacteria group bacterium]|nr:HIT family protein [Patescibacteria group bacterium]